MLQEGYRPSGWLGLLIGSKLYFSFHPAAVETDADFSKKMDALERELGDRGRGVSSRMSEGVPPSVAGRSLSPAGAPALARAEAPAPAPAPVPAHSLTPEPAYASDRSFTPSMQLSSPMPAPLNASDATASLVSVLLEHEERQQKLMLEREEKLREEAKAEKDELRQEIATMWAATQKLREEVSPAPPAEAISEDQMVALQGRLEALHEAELLSDDELFKFGDMIADFAEARATIGVVTMEIVHTNHAIGKVHKIIAVSETVSRNPMLARQLRRKFM